ncbi:MAG: hypothetical protein PHR26_01635 [Candidatus ainarchaeum sp.]|nr:hypothetical protein [Candidatus ainarchaeum sp.]MDD3975869.1 hypothetical protein [Candidatus ainarchaeum sp.]
MNPKNNKFKDKKYKIDELKKKIKTKEIRNQLTKNISPNEIANKFIKLIYINKKEQAIKEYEEYIQQFDKIKVPLKEIENIKIFTKYKIGVYLSKSIKSILKKKGYKPTNFNKNEIVYMKNICKKISEELIKTKLIKSTSFLETLKISKLDVYSQIKHAVYKTDIIELAEIINKLLEQKQVNKILGDANPITNEIRLINTSPQTLVHELMHIAFNKNNQKALAKNEFFIEFITNVINTRLQIGKNQTPKINDLNNPYIQGIIYSKIFFKKYYGNLDKLIDFIYSKEFLDKINQFD